MNIFFRLHISRLIIFLTWLNLIHAQLYDILNEEKGKHTLYTFRSTLSQYFRSKTDLVLVLDESGSIGFDNFQIAKSFSELVVRFFEVTPDSTRTAVVTFDNFAKLKFDYISSGDGDMCNFVTNIKQVDYGAQWTNTGDGLRKAGEVLRKGRSGSHKVIILLSDGLTSEGIEFIQPGPVAAQLRQEGMIIFCVGVAGASETELLTIANSPSHLYMIVDFNYIKRVNERLTSDNVNQLFVVQQNNNLCNKVCKAGRNCCDKNADCTCGTDGEFYCSCRSGYSGSGVVGKCTKCPKGFYKSTSGQEECFICPPNSITPREGATSRSECACFPGFIGNPDQSIPCRSSECPVLHAPLWGTTEPTACDNAFNAKCAFWCESPYCPYNGSVPNCLQQLSRKKQPPRVCEITGQWSGREFSCEEARCPSLNNPLNGIYQCDSSNYRIKTVCTLKCNVGYKIRGLERRRCQPNGIWSGEDAKCEAVTCSPKGLKVSTKVQIKPLECKTKPSPYGKNCQFSCVSGYSFIRLADSEDVDGIPVGLRTCGQSRLWEGRGERYRCKDTTPPVITYCPPSQITVPTAPSLKISRKVNWTLPTATDNDGLPPRIKLIEPTFFKGKPGTRPPATFLLGKNKLSYRVVDRSNLQSICSFTITVIDKERPKVTSCPSDTEIYTPDKSVAVTWKEPTFTDNSGVYSIQIQSHKSGDNFSTEKQHRVIYKAVDAAKNPIFCRFVVNAKGYRCPYQRPPQNGIISCTTITPLKQVCRVLCKKGYDIISQPKDGYQCLFSRGQGTWNTKNLWPDCSVVSDPTVSSPGVTVTASLKNCNDPKALDAIAKQYLKKICPNPKVCTVKTVNMKCGKKIIKIDLRTKRETESEGGVLTLEFEIDLNITALAGEDGANEDDIRDNFNDFLDKTVTSISTDETGIATATVTQRLDVRCKNGQILVNGYCVNCPIGTYHHGTFCKSCPLHSYQDEEATQLCKSCFPDTYTVDDRSIDNSSCKVPCEPGSFSDTGLEQCIACPKGTYQDLLQQTSCKKCPYPNNATTIEGADSIDECTMPCSPGAFSSTGFEPCDLCPIGSFQPESQKTECIPCDEDLWTREKGMTDISSCADNDICEPNPCQHGGNCTADEDKYVCTCATGFAGRTCDINIDDCEPELCHNGGTCIDGIDDYHCICPSGYTGSQCEEEVDVCLGDVCLNGGTCHKKLESFICDCKKGFAGKRCEFAFNDCRPNPCHNNGTCIDRSEGFYCCCPRGYAGHLCLERRDDCSPNPCHNNAICRLGHISYTCLCPKGFTGEECEINIDDCAGKTCLNHGTCIDGVDNFTCECMPGFKGPYCQTVLPFDFEVVFTAARISNYAVLETKEDLFGVTLAFWMKADQDPNQRSTPVSYSYKSRVNGSVEANALTLYDTRIFIISVHGKEVRTDIRASSDSIWHHYALTWDSLDGSLAVYKDGINVVKETNISAGLPLWRGFFVLGQEQDTLSGGFSATESFLGSLTQFNVWNFAMDETEIKQIFKHCGYIGNVIAWPNVKDHLVGEDITIRNCDLCETKNLGTCGQKEAECHCLKNKLTDEHMCGKALHFCEENTCHYNQECTTGVEVSFCDCQSGFTGKFCQYDLNECLDEKGGCSHGCVNTIGSYLCTCPEGHALSNDKRNCYITSYCSYHGSLFNEQEKWTENCSNCICSDGIVTCQEQECASQLKCQENEILLTFPTDCCPKCVDNSNQSRCIVKPNNFYQTFDGHHIKFTSSCSYILAQDCTSSTVNIHIENSASYPSRKNITLMIECDVLEITNDGHLLVNGKRTSIPYSDFRLFRVEHGRSLITGHHPKIERIIVTLHKETTLLWSSNGHVELIISDELKGKMCGLCGNSNGISEDDMMLRNYKTAESITEFIQSWRADHTRDCPTPAYIISGRPKPQKSGIGFCSLKSKKFQRAGRVCETLRMAAFHPCYEKLNPQGYYDMCVQDSCMCNSSLSLCHCDAIFTYEAECRRLGVDIAPWKGQKLCRNRCQNGKIFDICGPACTPTCTSEELINPQCLFTACRAGCHCLKGDVWHQNECIHPSHCPYKG